VREVRCVDLDEALATHLALGFRLDTIIAADDPAELLLSRGAELLRLVRDSAARERDGVWHRGRAGMDYRDLVPDRRGGALIASHIRVEQGGAVADYVHYHDIRVQLIFCVRGWVRLVYEDQGDPFEMTAGDCVVQPPQIRHRVLESSAGMEVVEIGSPARHETLVDHDLQLPTTTERRDRVFGGQRFVRHEAAAATWRPWKEGFEARDTGIAEATGGVAEVHVVRLRGSQPAPARRHDGELLFVFVLSGAATLRCDGRAEERLSEDDCCVVPAGLQHAWADASADLELLRVALPASR
jgi:quercetin dioxygenase-like cupin family protein